MTDSEFLAKRIEHLEELLQSSMEMNKKLMDILSNTKYLPRETTIKSDHPWQLPKKDL